MAEPVRLREIVDALLTQWEDALSFVNVETGEVIASMPRPVMGLAEESGDDEEAPDDVETGEWELALKIASSDCFKRLPTKFDIHEWAIMEEFAESVEQKRVRAELLDALHGSGAFRHFKNALRRNSMEPAWWELRERALRQIAIEWCEENGVKWK
jgi:hypothetical protein